MTFGTQVKFKVELDLIFTVNIPYSNVVEKNVYRLGLDNFRLALLQNVLFNFNGIKIYYAKLSIDLAEA